MQGLPNLILQWVPGVLAEVCTVEHSLPFNAEVSDGWDDSFTLQLLVEVLATFFSNHVVSKRGLGTCL
jgi:hypothetical protein